MKIKVKWNYYTDGDFLMRKNNFFQFEDDDGEEYWATEIFENEDEVRAKMEARSYLEQVLCETHILYTHYYIMKDLYRMFEEGMHFLYNKDGETEYYGDMTGNYDGTFLAIMIQE